MQPREQVKPPQSHFIALFRPQTALADLLGVLAPTQSKLLLSVLDNATSLEVCPGGFGS